jgi:hypothetical protein
MEVLKMKQKVYISYVIQTNNIHSHHSEIIEVVAPYYSFSFSQDTTTSEVMKWKEEKEKTLSSKKEERLVITNFFIV